MTYVKRLAHRLARWFQRRSALLFELKTLDAAVLQASWDVAEARKETEDLRDLLAVLVIPTEVRR